MQASIQSFLHPSICSSIHPSALHPPRLPCHSCTSQTPLRASWQIADESIIDGSIRGFDVTRKSVALLLPAAMTECTATIKAARKRAGQPVTQEVASRLNTSHSSPSPSSIAHHQLQPISNKAAQQNGQRGDEASEQEKPYSAVVTTIVTCGELDGVQYVDMLIDTGASCIFVRRSWAVNSEVSIAEMKQHIPVRFADRRTTVCTRKVRVSSLRVHNSKAACSLW